MFMTMSLIAVYLEAVPAKQIISSFAIIKKNFMRIMKNCGYYKKGLNGGQNGCFEMLFN